MPPDFDQIMREYGAAMKRVAAAYEPPGAAREDLEQDIALAIFQGLQRFESRSSLRTYLYRIAHNCGMRSLRKRPLDYQNTQEPKEMTTPEISLMKKDRYERLARSLRDMDLKWRQPIVMRLEGLSYEEIAETLDMPISTVGVRLHRATKALKDSMKEES